jgi:hypothetical protein
MVNKMKNIKIIVDGKEIKTIKINDQDIEIFLKLVDAFKFLSDIEVLQPKIDKT